MLTIDVPPLRDRGGDVLTLLEHFRDMYSARKSAIHAVRGSGRALGKLHIPGQRARAEKHRHPLGGQVSGTGSGADGARSGARQSVRVDETHLKQLNAGGFRLEEILNSWEQRYINAALKLSKGNLSEAARLLGVNRTTLYSKIQRLSSEN